MSNTVVILSKEFMDRINVALGEIAAKFSIPVLNELHAWVEKAQNEPHKLIADLEAHVAPMKAKIEADKAAAEVLAAVKSAHAADGEKAA